MTDCPEIRINRAPVLTLWAAVVAERLGYTQHEALTLGRAVAGLTAQSKGRRLGIYGAAPAPAREKTAAQREAMGADRVPLMGREIPCVRSEDGVRALSRATPIDPASVQRYLEGRFGEHLALVREAFVSLAEAYDTASLDAHAMRLYMRLRPETPKGEKGWGKAGRLDLAKVARLAEEARAASDRAPDLPRA